MTSRTAAPGPRVALFGVPAGNPNLGLHALMHAATAQLHARLPGLEPWIFDDGLGVRSGRLPLDDGVLDIVQCGARLSRRVHRPESYANMRITAALGRSENQAVAGLLGCSAVLDASGGDSFTDLYGPKRFRTVLAPKRLALQLGRPLVLLPQTYGPFASSLAKRRAARIVRQASMAWARDPESHEVLVDLAGPDYDPERHRMGVDMAFLLEPHRPGPTDADKTGWFEGDGRPLVGINVSGLLYNHTDGDRFGLTFDYRAVMRELVTRLLEQTDANIVLVDHVLARHADDRIEADSAASADILDRLDDRRRARVVRVPPGLDACETKWIVARTDWFCGARMHATIAALSSGVPAAAVGYSMKTRAVFDTCGVGSEVTEVAGLDDHDVVERLWASWLRRDQVRATLATRLPGVVRQAHRQMDEIAAVVQSAYESERRSA